MSYVGSIDGSPALNNVIKVLQGKVRRLELENTDLRQALNEYKDEQHRDRQEYDDIRRDKFETEKKIKEVHLLLNEA